MSCARLPQDIGPGTGHHQGRGRIWMECCMECSVKNGQKPGLLIWQISSFVQFDVDKKAWTLYILLLFASAGITQR